MICKKCGAQISDNATFCPKCGAAAHTQNAGGGFTPNSGKNNNTLLIAVIAAAALVLIAIISAAVGMLIMDEPEPEPTPAPQSTEAPPPTAAPTAVPYTAPPQPTPQVVYVTPVPEPPRQPAQQQVQSAAWYPSLNTRFKTYYNSSYKFSCDYPSDFIMYDDGGQLYLYTLTSPDGTAIEKIAAKPNEGETPASEYSNFLRANPGSVDYKNIGDDFFAVSVSNGVRDSYKYCKFKNGNLYWFEFFSPTSLHNVYDEYINRIYHSLNY